MEGADESTELWRHPKAVVFIKYETFGPILLLSSCYQKARLFTVIFNLPKNEQKLSRKIALDLDILFIPFHKVQNRQERRS